MDFFLPRERQWRCRGSHPSKVRRPSTHTMMDRTVSRVGGCIAKAFFGSLVRCSCINITTEDDEEPKDLPLIREDDNDRREVIDVRTTRRQRNGAVGEHHEGLRGC
ncbi:hypothetical protein HPP92_018183 [Vanilla planifolia]|uniref:Uncharacterized protein n=1 Tax=Vanilla planifolia TaxID=51239 RepID=A0A835QDW3_VANPL|nr:hypothetical protein HPP92_018183 [Vanilla planifolia]